MESDCGFLDSAEQPHDACDSSVRIAIVESHKATLFDSRQITLRAEMPSRPVFEDQHEGFGFPKKLGPILGQATKRSIFLVGYQQPAVPHLGQVTLIAE